MGEDPGAFSGQVATREGMYIPQKGHQKFLQSRDVLKRPTRQNIANSGIWIGALDWLGKRAARLSLLGNPETEPK